MSWDHFTGRIAAERNVATYLGGDFNVCLVPPGIAIGIYQSSSFGIFLMTLSIRRTHSMLPQTVRKPQFLGKWTPMNPKTKE